MVRRVEIPAHDADHVLHHVDRGGAVLVDEALAHRPHDHLRLADRLLLIEQRARGVAQVGIEREGNDTGNERGLLGGQHRPHGRERGFHHGIVALLLEAVLAQHRAHGDIDRAPGGVGRDHLALEVRDRFDRAVLEDEIFVAVAVADAVLEVVADHPQVVHAGVLDRERERRIGEGAHFEIAGRHRGDHQRRTGVVHRLEHVGLAEVLREVLFLQNDRRPVRDAHNPRHADLHGLRRGRADTQRETNEAAENCFC